MPGQMFCNHCGNRVDDESGPAYLSEAPQEAAGGKNRMTALIAGGVCCLVAIGIILAVNLPGIVGTKQSSSQTQNIGAPKQSSSQTRGPEETKQSSSPTQDIEETDVPVFCLVRVANYRFDGSVGSGTEYEYDTAGNQIKDIKYNSDGSVSRWYECEYDAAGNPIKRTSYNSDGSVSYWEKYEYNSAGNQIRETLYSTDGSVSNWTEYEYNSAGNPIKETHYISDGSVSRWIEYEYNSAGNQIREASYSSDNNASNWTEYEYNSAGNPIKETHYKSGGSIDYWTEYEYNSAGIRIKDTKYDSDGGIDYWTESEYDTAGKQIKKTYYNSGGKVSSWSEYEYKTLEEVKIAGKTAESGTPEGIEDSQTLFGTLADIHAACTTQAACETERKAAIVHVNSDVNPYDVIYDYGNKYDEYVQACDWSLVFDADYYAETFPMLATQYHNDKDLLLMHFRTVGIHEGRQGSKNFNVGAYSNNCENSVSKEFGEDYAAYYIYYMLNYETEKNVNTVKADNGKSIKKQYIQVLTWYQKEELEAVNKYREQVDADPTEFDSELAAFASYRAYLNVHDGYEAHDWLTDNFDNGEGIAGQLIRKMTTDGYKFSENAYTIHTGSSSIDIIAAQRYKMSSEHYEAMVAPGNIYIGISGFSRNSETDQYYQFDVYLNNKINTVMHPAN